MMNMNKQFYVGETIDHVLRNNLNGDFSIVSDFSIYTYYITVKSSVHDKKEYLQINCTETGKTQLRVQKEDNSFMCFVCPENITTVEGISIHLFSEYLKYKKLCMKQKLNEASFHERFSKININC